MQTGAVDSERSRLGGAFACGGERKARRTARDRSKREQREREQHERELEMHALGHRHDDTGSGDAHARGGQDEALRAAGQPGKRGEDERQHPRHDPRRDRDEDATETNGSVPDDGARDEGERDAGERRGDGLPPSVRSEPCRGERARAHERPLSQRGQPGEPDREVQADRGEGDVEPRRET